MNPRISTSLLVDGKAAAQIVEPANLILPCLPADEEPLKQAAAIIQNVKIRITNEHGCRLAVGQTIHLQQETYLTVVVAQAVSGKHNEVLNVSLQRKKSP